MTALGTRACLARSLMHNRGFLAIEAGAVGEQALQLDASMPGHALS